LFSNLRDVIWMTPYRIRWQVTLRSSDVDYHQELYTAFNIDSTLDFDFES